MVKFNDLKLPKEYENYFYMAEVIEDSFKNGYVEDVISDIFNAKSISSEFLFTMLIALYFAFKKDNSEISNVIEKIVFGGKELLDFDHFPFFFLNKEAKKNIGEVIENNFIDHIEPHLISIDDPMIDFIDSPRGGQYKDNFMKALKLTGKENRRIVIKIVGKFGVIVGAFIGSSKNENNAKNEILKSMYKKCELALSTPLSEMDKIDGWLGYA